MLEEGDMGRLGVVRQLWKEWDNYEKPNVFQAVEVAGDGGLGDITSDKLLYPLLLNVVYIARLDWKCAFLGECVPEAQNEAATVVLRCIEHEGHQCKTDLCMLDIARNCSETHRNFEETQGFHREPFLMTRWILQGAVPGERIIATLELFALVVLLIRLVRLSLMAVYAVESVFRWICVSQLFVQVVPMLSCFSLMRLLYYITPCVIGTEIYYQVSFLKQRIAGRGWKCSFFLPFAWYLVSRLLCLIIGLDVFLVKFRAVSPSISQSAAATSRTDALNTILFLFQMLGVVNLTWFAKERLLLFIFAAEDGTMTAEQRAMAIVWNALLAKTVWKKLGCFRFFVVMLGFDDYDFQTLVMDEKPKALNEQPVNVFGFKQFFGLSPTFQAGEADEEKPEVRTCGRMCQERLMMWALMD